MNRGKDSPPLPVTDFMFRQKAREKVVAPAARVNGHAPAAPAPPPASQGMRLPLPGERPASKYAPGVPDHVIEKFDAYARRHGTARPKKKPDG